MVPFQQQKQQQQSDEQGTALDPNRRDMMETKLFMRQQDGTFLEIMTETKVTITNKVPSFFPPITFAVIYTLFFKNAEKIF